MEEQEALLLSEDPEEADERVSANRTHHIQKRSKKHCSNFESDDREIILFVFLFSMCLFQHCRTDENNYPTAPWASLKTDLKPGYVIFVNMKMIFLTKNVICVSQSEKFYLQNSGEQSNQQEKSQIQVTIVHSRNRTSIQVTIVHCHYNILNCMNLSYVFTIFLQTYN